LLRLAAAGHGDHLLEKVGDGDGLGAVRARAAGADAACEDAAVGAALLAEEALLAFGAFVDGVVAPGPGSGDGDRAGRVVVAAPERGCSPLRAIDSNR
jgi:hypothetical protein